MMLSIINSLSIRFEEVEEHDDCEVLGDTLEDEDTKEEKDEKRHCDTFTEKEIASKMTHIQKMNNSSALSLIDAAGKYDKSIESLNEALYFLRVIDDNNKTIMGNNDCNGFSLDGCIEHSEEQKFVTNLMTGKKKSLNVAKNLWKYKKKAVMKEATTDNREEDDYYKTPILIPKVSIQQEGQHNMGSTLFLLITFNLALAHHLKISEKKEAKNISKSTTTTNNKKRKRGSLDPSSSSLSETLIKNTFHFYKHILKTIYDDDNALPANHSEQFIKIVRKNLNHLLRKHHHILNTTTSTTTPEKKIKIAMDVVEESSSNPSSFLYEHHKELLRHRYASPFPSSSFSSEETESSSSSSNYFVDNENNTGVFFSMRLQNAMRTSSLFVHLQSRRNIHTAYAAYSI